MRPSSPGACTSAPTKEMKGMVNWSKQAAARKQACPTQPMMHTQRQCQLTKSASRPPCHPRRAGCPTGTRQRCCSSGLHMMGASRAGLVEHINQTALGVPNTRLTALQARRLPPTRLLRLGCRAACFVGSQSARAPCTPAKIVIGGNRREIIEMSCHSRPGSVQRVRWGMPPSMNK